MLGKFAFYSIVFSAASLMLTTASVDAQSVGDGAAPKRHHGSTGPTGPTGATGAAGINGSALGYGQFISTAVQTGIGLHDVVNVTQLIDENSDEFTALDNGVQVSLGGVYQIYYRVVPSGNASFYLSATTDGTIAGSFFGNGNSSVVASGAGGTTYTIDITSAVSGTVITSLYAGDVVTIRSNYNAGNISTVRDTVHEDQPTAPVEIVLLRLE